LNFPNFSGRGGRLQVYRGKFVVSDGRTVGDAMEVAVDRIDQQQ
jgi:hypothetical protein